MPISRTKRTTGRATQKSVRTSSVQRPPAVGYTTQYSPVGGLRSKYDTLPVNKPLRSSVIANQRLPGDNAPKPSQSDRRIAGWKEGIDKKNKHNTRTR